MKNLGTEGGEWTILRTGVLRLIKGNFQKVRQRKGVNIVSGWRGDGSPEGCPATNGPKITSALKPSRNNDRCAAALCKEREPLHKGAGKVTHFYRWTLRQSQTDRETTSRQAAFQGNDYSEDFVGGNMVRRGLGL